MNRLFPLFAALIFINIFIFPAREIQAAYPAGWTYSQRITVDFTKVAATLTNFVVLVNLTNANLKSAANGGHVTQDDGGDIRFENASDVKLDHEIEKYVATNGELIVWVKVDVLSATTNTVINMYYGSADTNNQWNTTNTWESSAKMVSHFNETSGGTNYDSTTNALNGTIEGASLITTGKVDGAESFDGSDDRVNYGDFDYFRSTYTIEYWFYVVNPASPSFQCIAARWSSVTTPYYHHRLRLGSTSFLQMNSGTATIGSLNVLASNTWYHAVATRDGAANLSFYLNGVFQGSGAIGALLDYSNNFVISDVNNSTRFKGMIDEMRFYTRVLSAEEILTQYNNQNSPSTFYSVGAEQRLNQGTIIKIRGS